MSRHKDKYKSLAQALLQQSEALAHFQLMRSGSSMGTS